MFKDRTRPSPGNHEYETPGASGYFTYFGAAAGEPAKGYYSYDLGSWHVISLNSNCSSVAGGCAAGSPQEQWLKADLAAHSNECTLAYWHHPRFSSGIHGDEAFVGPFWDALYQAGADVVLNGHDHDYERFAPQNPSGQADPAQGISEFVVGTGGAELRNFRTIKPNSEVRVAQQNGVLKMTLHPDGYDWQFLTAPVGTIADTGSASCHGAPSGPPTDATATTDGRDGNHHRYENGNYGHLDKHEHYGNDEHDEHHRRLDHQHHRYENGNHGHLHRHEHHGNDGYHHRYDNGIHQH